MRAISAVAELFVKFVCENRHRCACRLLHQYLFSLQYLHENEVIHRDLKVSFGHDIFVLTFSSYACTF